MNLTEALEVFKDNINDIKAACVENMSWNIAMTRPFKTNSELAEELAGVLLKMELEEVNKGYRVTFERIVALQEHRRPSKAMNDITALDIERAKAYPIQDMIETKVFRAGKRYTAHCPFHQERSPSFYIHADNRWSCFGACGEHGDSIAFYMKKHGVDFKIAVRELARK